LSDAVTEGETCKSISPFSDNTLELSGVPYIDSAGLAALIGAMQEVEGYGGKFLLAGLQEIVREVLESSRLDQVFQIFPDADAALAAS
jgi:anti-sigma B factor antagonist